MRLTIVGCGLRARTFRAGLNSDFNGTMDLVSRKWNVSGCSLGEISKIRGRHRGGEGRGNNTLIAIVSCSFLRVARVFLIY